MADSRAKKIRPFILTALLLVIDQVSKAIIVRFVDPFPFSQGIQVIGDFFRIIHARNLGVAFSIGGGFSGGLRSVLFMIIPVLVIVVVILYYFKVKDITPAQRWALCGILGGGLGNIIDRIFRPAGVVDFLDFKFYGILGLDRWPTFNVADMSVVICGILLVITFFTYKKETHEQKT